MTTAEALPVKTIAAAKFKATCLALMDEVQSKREPVVITKNGKPVARLEPLEIEDDPLAIYRFAQGKITIHGDIVAPAADPVEWANLE